jgi:signal transduction histidine kinase/ketosteroid isomerase-like protein
MKLTSSQETEVWQVYDTWLTAYLNADVKTYNAYLDDDYHFIGSTNNEEFLNRTDATTFFEHTGEQFAGIMDLRNENKILEVFNTSIFITHFCDVWFINDEDRTYYGRFRLSSVMQKKKEGWRFIYQHFSMPDSKSDEGDSIGFDKVNAENIELKEAIKRRTIDLENKNRELEVEAALERVRARSSAMHSSDELGEVIALIFGILDEFNISVNDGVALITFNEDNKDLNEWMANPGFSKAMNFHLPYFDHPVLSNLWDAKNRGDDILIERYSAEESRSFLNHIFEHSDFKHTPDAVKEYCLAADTYATTIALQKHTGIFINDYSGISLTSSEIDLLKKFSAVFEQTYTRFLDIQKAEAQARESEIQLALERVRARSLAMQKPDDLNKVNEELLRQLKELHIDGLSGVSIWLIDEEGQVTAWDLSNPGNMRDPRSATVRYDATKFDLIGEPWRIFNSSDMDYVVLDYPVEKLGKAVKEWAEVDTSVADEFQEALDDGSLTHQWNPLARHSHGFLSIDLIKPPSDGIREIVTKMASVFSLAYRRFLDLQKAEAQAREAQIEAALERVRSRTMAMQKSSELGDVAAELFAQMNLLVNNLWTCGFVLCEKGRDEDEWWLSMDGDFTRGFFLPNVNDYAHSSLYEGWVKGEDFRAVQLDGESLQQHYDWLMDIPVSRAIFEEMDAAGIARPDWQKLHAAYFSKGYLVLITREPCEEEEIFKRFASVFDLTYTRFLDLQKAEKQARESEIQLALERVRAKSLAMHKSEELGDLSLELVKQVQNLGIETWFCAFNIHDDHPDGSLEWGSNGEGVFPQYRTPKEGIFLEYLKAGERGEELYVKEIPETECKAHYEYLCSLPGVGDQLLQMKANGIPFPTSQIDHVAFFKYGYVLFITFEPVPEAHDIFRRFSQVFEQSYTRFLDLQKAEAQTRKAKIEAALERSRAQSMMMKHSDEIDTVSNVFHEQLTLLGIPTEFSYVWLPDEDNQTHQFWASWSEENNGETTLHSKQITYPLDKSEPYTAACFEAWANPDKVLEEFIPPGDIAGFFDVWKELLSGAEKLKAENFPEGIYYSEAYMRFGCFGINIRRKLSGEEKNILKRFSVEFERAYTRFLDLKKAEEQAREAKIEAALEKVRSRSMGMQSSEELPEVANLMFLEVQNLGVNAWSCGYCILEEDRRSSICIMSSEGTIQKPFLLPHSGEESFDEWDEFMHSDDTFLMQELKGDAIESHYDFMTSLPQLKPVFQDLMDAGLSLPTYQINHLCKFSHGFLLFITYEPVPEAHDIFKRFTAVFNQTYTRFLDLEKSEQRAREAEVELALERVRSQVTAMQTSSDLFDIVVNMRKEFISLGHDADYFWHMTWGADSYDMSMTSEDGNRIGMVIKIPRFVHDAIPGLSEWEKGTDPVYVLALNGDDAWDYIENMNTHGKYEQADPNAPTEEVIQAIGGLTFIIARTTHGEIGYSLAGEVPNPPEEALDTLVRFAGVFDLAYQRFEDLQESEQQARLILEERDRLEAALNELHATQDQLVQQEKLASLGQLTAGIAHEIKNPLNFVNNFSDLSLELVEEVRSEIRELRREKTKGKSETASPLSRGDGDPSLDGSARGVSGQAENSGFDSELILDILSDIEANLKTIHKHGTRADSIVKSMLMHSRGGDGEMEPTSLNPLIKEYVNLAFHGMRAGKESINVDIDLQLDENVGEVSLVAEDFSRVILNLTNNAFDAMKEKTLQGFETLGGLEDYRPKLTIRTFRKENTITIEIEDNGPGIPDEMRDKILQPFFTTKKGTQGTGLGLSITNDIIKAHGGNIKIDSVPGESTTFKLTIPGK